MVRQKKSNNEVGQTVKRGKQVATKKGAAAPLVSSSVPGLV